MKKKSTYQLIYQVDAETTEHAIMLVFELQQNTGIQPTHIVMPSGSKIPWNAYAAHQFAAEGRISEKQFIAMSLSKQ
jgi:hypothetical protein